MISVRHTSVFDGSLNVNNQVGEVVIYLAPLAGVPPTLREVNEAEPSFTSTPNTPGLEISMNYPNTMKVSCQLIHLRSAGNRDHQ